MPIGGFFTNQRLSNIYDGPSYQDSNAYLDITVADCPIWKTETEQGCMYGSQINVLRSEKNSRTAPPDPGKLVGDCQQPNIRVSAQRGHRLEAAERVLLPTGIPLEEPFLRQRRSAPLRDRSAVQDGKYVTDDDAVNQQYCTAAKTIFNDWTSIDRQTELTDDDGTLTGLSSNNAAKETGFRQRRHVLQCAG